MAREVMITQIFLKGWVERLKNKKTDARIIQNFAQAESRLYATQTPIRAVTKKTNQGIVKGLCFTGVSPARARKSQGIAAISNGHHFNSGLKIMMRQLAETQAKSVRANQ